MSIALRKRVKEIALLKALGFKAVEVFGLVVAESFGLGIAGGLVRCLAAFVLVWLAASYKLAAGLSLPVLAGQPPHRWFARNPQLPSTRLDSRASQRHHRPADIDYNRFEAFNCSPRQRSAHVLGRSIDQRIPVLERADSSVSRKPLRPRTDALRGTLARLRFWS